MVSLRWKRAGQGCQETQLNRLCLSGAVLSLQSIVTFFCLFPHLDRQTLTFQKDNDEDACWHWPQRPPLSGTIGNQFFFHHFGPLLSSGDKPYVDIFLCVNSLATRLWETMFVLFTINLVFSWICSLYCSEIIFQNEKGLIVVIRTCNRNRFHKKEQNVGIVCAQEQWTQSSLDDVYTLELLNSEKNQENSPAQPYVSLWWLFLSTGWLPAQGLEAVSLKRSSPSVLEAILLFPWSPDRSRCKKEL